MRRFIVTTPSGAFVRELAPSEVLECTRTDEINGEHSLQIRTTEVLEREQRILVRDAMGLWHEYVVMRCDEAHASGDSPTGDYWCPWSLMHDLAVSYVTGMPGVQSPVYESVALEAALAGQTRWTVGNVKHAVQSGASMYYMSGYQALGVVVEVWGGEIDATITVDATAGVVTSRAVDLYAEIGDQATPRRFDWSRDMTSIRRRVDESAVPCRIVPRGKGEETDTGGYGRKISIASVNGGVEWLENAETAAAVKMANGSGGYDYPTIIIENSDCETPADLKAWGQSVLQDYTTPKVTYDADVVQLARAGMDATGLALGDAVQCVDRGFSADGLRVQGRVSKLVVNELDDTDVKVTIGYTKDAFTSRLGSMSNAVAKLGGDLVALSSTTYEYLNNLLDHINAQINALGGWSYMVPGRGMITYSAEVSDPEVGAEVKAIINAGGEGSVVEVSGGGIRLANSLTAGGDWNWRTLITSGHILADLVTAAQLTAGYIGSPTGANYWNLDTGYMKLSADLTVGGADNSNGVIRVLDASGNVISTLDKDGANIVGSLTMKMNGDDAGAHTYALLGEMYWQGRIWGSTPAGGGAYKRGLFMHTEGEAVDGRLMITPRAETSYYTGQVSAMGAILCEGPLLLGASSSKYPRNPEMLIGAYNSCYIAFASGFSGSSSYEHMVMISDTSGFSVTVLNELFGVRSFNSNGTSGEIEMSVPVVGYGSKSRLVTTDDYGDRLLYCYETPQPLFGDVGGGVIGDDGLCYVEIDDIFSETVRTDRAYHVFLQRYGEGELWVAERNPMCFVVRGTPGLEFGWEVKAMQSGYEHTRLEEHDLRVVNEKETSYGENLDMEYADDLAYASEIESLYWGQE